jgi:hypothetical protein
VGQREPRWSERGVIGWRGRGRNAAEWPTARRSREDVRPPASASSERTGRFLSVCSPPSRLLLRRVFGPCCCLLWSSPPSVHPHTPHQPTNRRPDTQQMTQSQQNVQPRNSASQSANDSILQMPCTEPSCQSSRARFCLLLCVLWHLRRFWGCRFFFASRGGPLQAGGRGEQKADGTSAGAQADVRTVV